MQIALGGWTSTNYAAVACPDFPTCQGAWWPPTDFRHAFVLWHGLHVDYEGGVLGNAARVTIQLTHRRVRWWPPPPSRSRLSSCCGGAD